MSATNAFETALLSLIFLNLDIPNVGDAAGLQNSAVPGSFFISLHTADPGETGAQNTSEANYTGYARVAVARSGAGWAVAGNNISNAALVNFPPCTAGANTVTHFGIGSDAIGAGNMFFTGSLNSTLNISAGITPSFGVGELDVNGD
jgi:hypothetical protein